MITLYGIGPGFGLPEISPHVTKTEVQLKMAGLDYRTARGHAELSPKGQLPFIEDDGEFVADSTFIRATSAPAFRPILTPFFDSPLRRRAERFEGLLAYRDRMMRRFYPGFGLQGGGRRSAA